MKDAARPQVVMINKAYPPWIGGIERHVRDMSEALVRRGWRVSALVCNPGWYEIREVKNGVQILRAPRLARVYSQPIVTRFWSYLHELKPDLLHVHVPFPLGWWTARAAPDAVPLACTWHSDIVRQWWLRPFFTHFEQRFLRRCSAIIVTSETLRLQSRALRPHREKCRVIPLAVPPDPELNEARIRALAEQIRSSAGQPGVLFVGRLVGYKGLTYVIEAMKSIPAALWIAGDGPLREKLQRQAERARPEGGIRFLGTVSEEEKAALYQAAAVLVLPSISRNEAFGYVLLEAMERGCPVITTNLTTGVRDVNQEGVSGLAVPPRDAWALSEAIRRILQEGGLREALSAGARQRARECFNFAETVSRLETVYRALLHDSPSD
ncbi:MAG: glycosyltransferase [bacterium]